MSGNFTIDASLLAILGQLKQIKGNRIFLTRENENISTFLIDTSEFIKRDKETREVSNQDDLDTIEDAIFLFIKYLYQSTLSSYLDAFKEFLNDPYAYKDDKKGDFRYPLLEIYVRDASIGGPESSLGGPVHRVNKHFGYVTDPGAYEVSVTCPSLYETYLRRQIRELLQNHSPVVRVRLGPRVIPVHFAIEADSLGEATKIYLSKEDFQKINVQVNNRIAIFFDVPLLGEIDDIAVSRSTETVRVPSLEYINKHYFRGESLKRISDFASKIRATKRVPNQTEEANTGNPLDETGLIYDESFIEAALKCEIKDKASLIRHEKEYKISPLSLFNGDRIDYSLGRIRHYTKTSPADFQNFVIFTNYQMYIDEFLKYAAAHVLLRAAIDKPADFELPYIIEQLSKENINIERAFPALKTDPVSIAVPLYRNKNQHDNDNKTRHLDVKWLTSDGRITVEENDACCYEKEQKTLRIGRAKLRSCVRFAAHIVLPVFHSKIKIPIIEEDKVFYISFVREMFSFFLDGWNSDGLLGPKHPQMPAYHLIRGKCSGISIVNIGVGPSNAKTMTDHIAVLRPHTFLMLGHCAGLRSTQELGHYVLADGYLRDDSVLDRHFPPHLPIPSIAHIHDAIIKAFTEITGIRYSRDKDNSISERIRTGAVATVMDRNWELRYPDEMLPLELAKCIGLDMESATVAANGSRFSVPHATFLCVSDRPLHGDLKLEGMADSFYRDAIGQHFEIAIRAVEKLCALYRAHGIGTRRLRRRDQPPFQ